LSKPCSLRSDAARNRERLIAVATERFSTGDSAVTLDAIAQAAKVGIGTLYRHFPTREALVEAVYRSELDSLGADAHELLKRNRAIDALRTWMNRYAKFVATKHAMLDVLRALWAANQEHIPETRARIQAIIAKFVEVGSSDGTIRGDILPEDVTVGMVGIVMATANATDPDQARRLLELLAEGLGPRRP
jgi:AcrR family transcriptional regulator